MVKKVLVKAALFKIYIRNRKKKKLEKKLVKKAVKFTN
jgi:hypothetical protein